jgi:hypothetical protein
MVQNGKKKKKTKKIKGKIMIAASAVDEMTKI